MAKRKKKHWMQTPKGKRHARKLAEIRHAKRNGDNGESVHQTKDYSAHVAYIFGRTEAITEVYARSNGIPFATLATGVATLLLSQAGGAVLGSKHRVSRVQRSAAE